ncbi:MAG: VCBS repeat-containing protein [Verrucomicrobiales bacterium]|nr:VCBS repeat-containing protein [Verrucomicrobiales bacterium]
MNGDGYTDVVIAQELAPNLVYLNDARGHFSDSGQQLGSTSNRSYGGAALDVDGDGDLDLLFANYHMDDPSAFPLHLYINDGSGMLTEKGGGFGRPNVWYRSVSIGDLDGDGRADACVGNSYGIEIWHNESGNFEKTQELPAWSSTWDTILVDIDQDGDLDAVAAEYSSPGSISEIWVNDGAGRLQNSGRHLCCGGNLGVAAADLDEDGAVDLFLSGTTGKVWLNQSAPPQLKITSIGKSSVSGVVLDPHLPSWSTHFGVYCAAFVPGSGWSSFQGCEEIPRLAGTGSFTFEALPSNMSRIMLALAPTGGNVHHLPCLDQAESLPPELEVLGFAQTVIELPVMTVTREAGSTFIRWPTNLSNVRLETAPNLESPWTAAAVTKAGEYEVGLALPRAFFRLR